VAGVRLEDIGNVMGDGGLSAAGGSARLQFLGSTERARKIYYVAAAVMAALIPLILFAGLWVRTLLNQNERELRSFLDARAASLSARLDAEMEEEFSVLRAIASLDSLDAPDLAAFRTSAGRMISVIPQWSMLSLVDPTSLQQLVNTLGPASPDLPPGISRDIVGQVSRDRQPAIATSFAPGVSQGGAVLLYLPVIRNDAVRYVLVAALKAEAVQDLLQQGLEPKLLTVVIDKRNRILARSRGLGDFLGRETNNSFQDAVDGRASGLFMAETLDNQHVFTVFQRSPLTGWVTVAAADRRQYDLDTQRSTWTLVGTGALSLTLAGVLAVFLFYNVMERRVSDERLAASRALGELDARLLTTTQEALAEQRKASSEREVLLREIYHRVKNNLQIIQSLLQLGSRNLSTEQREPFESAIRRIGAMARVHTLLYKSPDLASIDFKDYLEELVRETAEGFGADVRGIRTELDAESMRVPLDTAVPLAFITVEILTNAFKHAFPDRAQGVIAVRCRQEDGTGILTISDSGVGIPKERAGSRRPLGLTLVHKLVEQIGGSLETPAPGGSRYEVAFPLVPHQQATVLPPAPRA
jgi:two-component sensor histidine kinase